MLSDVTNNILITRKCSKCGAEYNIMVTPEENNRINNGALLSEIFDNRSKILQEQVSLNLCDACFTKRNKGRS